MEINSKNKLKLAIQKEGRLTQETLEFLRKSGLEFESYKQKLMSSCRNFPLEIIFVRDNDISGYVENGTVDLGILGQNLLNEMRPKVKKLLDLRYGFCSLVVAVPKESQIQMIQELKGKKVATAYPKSTFRYFKKYNIPVEIVTISGSVEITPILGMADAVTDLTSTGSTLVLNDLRVISEIYNSESVLISSLKVTSEDKKQFLLNKLLIRFKAVLSAQRYKYVMMIAPEKNLPRLVKIIPGLKTPTVARLVKPGWVSVTSVIKEDIFWETVDRLQTAGAFGITVLPVEKMII